MPNVRSCVAMSFRYSRWRSERPRTTPRLVRTTISPPSSGTPGVDVVVTEALTNSLRGRLS